MKIRALMFFSTLVAFYLLGAFIRWDFNAGNWPEGGRVLVGSFGLLFAIFAATFPRDIL